MIHTRVIDDREQILVRRLQLMPSGTIQRDAEFTICKTTEAARELIAHLHPGAVLLQPSGSDPDPSVLEVWG